MRKKKLFLGLTTQQIELIEKSEISSSDTALQKCVPDTVFERLLAKGSYGETYTACLTDVCAYVGKLVRITSQSEQTAFEHECRIAIFAGEQEFGPKVIRTVVCKGKSLFSWRTPKFGLIIMERYTGHIGSLFHEGKCKPAHVTQINQSVERMHNAGIWHNDLHRGNILYRPKGRGAYEFRVIDFGLAWPLFSPVPKLLRLADIMTWSIGQHVQKRGRSIYTDVPLDPASKARLDTYLTTHYKVTSEEFAVAWKWRVYDEEQSQVQNERWGPMASFDMYQYAVQQIAPAAIQFLGAKEIVRSAVYLNSDHRYPDAAVNSKLLKVLEQRAESTR